ncbi:hypothetical protein B0I35DRAFT_35806 [Stachybotrys elegans]|uniref:F-box domain-containing protein n=1 Tax=Stachybotrys elegans TaxID=80388 RepID=A0A8K0T836_9HYPO|nr:hypothetical protein B0I35DRAFT_35806 [Stachybotrys elegans]
MTAVFSGRYPRNSTTTFEIDTKLRDAKDRRQQVTVSVIESPTTPQSPTMATVEMNYPMYSGLQTSPGRRPKSYDVSPPFALNRPRRLSNNSTATTSTTRSSQSGFSGSRTPSRGSMTSVESVDTNSSARQDRPGKPAGFAVTNPYYQPAAATAPVAAPAKILDVLPGEVIQLVLANLKDLHLNKASDSCATCYMRDLCSVSLSSRRAAKFAQAALYEDIQLVGPDSAAHQKRFKVVQGTRMLLLRRTLRASPQLARLVRRLKVPSFDMPANGVVPKGSMSLDQYEDLVASLVMACPGLESLAGPVSTYQHGFKKIFHALSTRKNLLEMDWLIEAAPRQQQRSSQSPPPSHDLHPSEQTAFFELHVNWTSLTTLTIHCLPGATLNPTRLLKHTLRRLKSLQHLHLCNLSPSAFDDSTLLSLPPLQSLTLSHIRGISSEGLSAFATLPHSVHLRNLQLRHTPLASLPVLARLLSNLRSLTSFALVQAYAPTMPEADTFALWLMPYLASASMVRLHWDITSSISSATPADDILARSIAAKGFPKLRMLRAPNDPDGIFQSLCQPVFRVDLPQDRLRSSSFSISSASTGTASPSPIQRLKKTATDLSTTSTSSSNSAVSLNHGARTLSCTNLSTARLAAQERLENAKHTPRFAINITDEDGSCVEAHEVAGFIGTVGSVIQYNLLPDAGSDDERGGLVDVKDLTPNDGPHLDLQGGARAGCQGRWNMTDGDVADRQEDDSWWHTERARWHKMQLN